MRLGRAPLLIAMIATVVLAACGDDDGASVRNVGGTASSGSGSASGSGSGSGTGHASGSATAAAHCEPVGDATTADTTVDVTLDEWSITAAESEVPAGTITFAATNNGEDAHEVVVVRSEDVDSLPTTDEGIVDEEQLPEGAFIGEIEAFPSGEDCTGTFELEPGTYALFCNILEEEAGELENHYELGMRMEIEVTG
jgi:plastocyanin